MKKTRKILAMAACAILLVCISVGATVAYLTSTDEVTNTFTVGSVAIALDETDVTVDGVKDTDARVDENTYKLMPGHSYIKDPTVHFAAGSEASYLFVKVTNDINTIEDGYYDATGAKKGTIKEQITANGWTELTGVEGVTGVYYKKVGATDVAVDYPVFEGFKIKDDAAIAGFAPETTVNPETGKTEYTRQTKVTVTAYAVQADGFADAKAAWDATFGKN